MREEREYLSTKDVVGEKDRRREKKHGKSPQKKSENAFSFGSR